MAHVLFKIYPMPNMKEEIENLFKEFVREKSFPCIGAKAAVSMNEAFVFTAGSIKEDDYDKDILQYLYSFIDKYRENGNHFFSALIFFTDTDIMNEAEYEKYMWQRLQSISDLDAINFSYDSRVSSHTESPEFSFSLKQESFFIIGMHPGSSRPARRFQYPAFAFNPHQQFERMRETGKYEIMKKAVRKKDILLAGSINPMLRDHGATSEVWQYSGKNYATLGECPFKSKHKS